MNTSLHSGQQNSSSGLRGVGGIFGVGAGPAASAGAIAKTRIQKHLVVYGASLSEEYYSTKAELQKLRIEFQMGISMGKHILNNLGLCGSFGQDSCLCPEVTGEDKTEDNARKLRRFDQESEEHLQDLEDALEDLPSVIAAMKECAKTAANLDSRRVAVAGRDTVAGQAIQRFRQGKVAVAGSTTSPKDVVTAAGAAPAAGRARRGRLD